MCDRLPVDALAGLLDGPRAQGAFLLRAVFAPPWSMRIEDRSPLTIMAVLAGEAWVRPDGGDPVRLAPGDTAVAVGPAPYTVADGPGTAPQVRILPGQVCVTPDGAEHPDWFGTRTWGNDAAGSTTLLVGTYEGDGEVGGRLLRALPRLLVVPAGQLDTPLVPLLGAEIGKDEPGQEAVLDRLLDLLLIAVLRAWFARPDAAAPGWYRAHADPVVGPALRLLHHEPARSWSVASLATETGVSRAALARRFTELVGEPPMSFLAGWRLALAADLLRDPQATLGAVARQVGYGSPYALSTAFKRVRGVSPREHRAAIAG
jgi:AraC-like DNA-binding protein